MATPTEDQKRLNEAIERSVRLLEQVTRETKRITSENQKQLRVQNEIQTSIQEIQALENRKISASEEYQLRLETQVNVSNEQFGNIKKQIEALQAQSVLLDDILSSENDRNKLSQEQQDQAEQNIKNLRLKQKELEKERKKILQITAEDKKRANAANSTRAIIEEAGAQFGLAADTSKTFLGQLENTVFTAGGMKTSFVQAGKSLTSMLSPMNVAVTLASKMATETLNMAMRMDQAFAQFQKATTSGLEYNEMIDDVRMNNLAAGVGFDKTVSSMTALYNNFLDFTSLAPEIQKELVETTSVLEALGVSSDTTAGILESLTNTFQQNAKEAAATAVSIAKFAKSIGVSAQKISADFQQALPALAQFGDQSVEMFKRMAVEAKATGISIGTMLSQFDRLDTFEGAADAAGSLSAALGGAYINAIDLATTDDKIGLIRDAFMEAGVSVEELSRQQTKMFAGILGLSTDEFRKQIGNSREALEAMAAQEEAAAKLKEEVDAVRNGQMGLGAAMRQLRQDAQNATTTGEKFSLALESLTAAALPLLEAINFVAQGILDMNDFTGGYLIPTLGFAALGFIALKLAGVSAGIAILKAFFPITAFLGALLLTMYGIIKAMDAINNALYGGNVDTIKYLKGQAGLDIPGFAEGVTGAEGGPAIVGEKGPEMVTLPEGANVITNENVEKLSSITTTLEKEQAEIAAGPMMTQQTQGTARAPTRPIGGRSQSGGSMQKTIVLNLDGRELGRAVVDLLNSEMDMTILGV